MEFTLLDAECIFALISDFRAATILYHMLGGNKNHFVVDARMRWNGWGGCEKKEGQVQSFDMLAKDPFGMHHSMTVRFLASLDDLSEIEEHRFAKVWERNEDGRFLICCPAARVLVYFTQADLPGGKLVCRYGFPMTADDLSLPAELPTQIVSTSVNDGSELAEFVQYLKHPDPQTQKYGQLSKRVEELRTEWET